MRVLHEDPVERPIGLEVGPEVRELPVVAGYLHEPFGSAHVVLVSILQFGAQPLEAPESRVKGADLEYQSRLAQIVDLVGVEGWRDTVSAEGVS